MAGEALREVTLKRAMIGWVNRGSERHLCAGGRPNSGGGGW